MTSQGGSDGLEIACDRPSVRDLSRILTATSDSGGLIHSLAVEGTDPPDLAKIPASLLANTSSNIDAQIHRIRIANTNVQDVDERAFEGAGKEGWATTHLAITGSKLKSVPRAVAKVPSLRHLDLRSNAIEGIFPYTFFGRSKVSHLNLNENRLADIAENAFLGLENNLKELLLDGNAFEQFPMPAVKILKKLQVWEYISSFPATTNSFKRTIQWLQFDLTSCPFCIT